MNDYVIAYGDKKFPSTSTADPSPDVYPSPGQGRCPDRVESDQCCLVKEFAELLERKTPWGARLLFMAKTRLQPLM
jgi:hypothetical protein